MTIGRARTLHPAFRGASRANTGTSRKACRFRSLRRVRRLHEVHIRNTSRGDLCSALLTRRCLGTLKGAVLLAASVGAQAQAHEKRVGEYVLRSSTVATQTFDEATARAHGIDPAPTRAVINVTVSRKSAKGRQNVRADVAVSAAKLDRPATCHRHASHRRERNGFLPWHVRLCFA